MRKKDKNRLIRIIISAVTLVLTVTFDKLWGFPISLFIGFFDIFPLLIYLISYIPVGYTVLLSAARNIAHGQVFDENFLMSTATVAALVTGEYAEAVFVMFFYQVGELFEHIAVGKSRNSIKALLSLRADTAFIEDENGNLCEADCEEIKVGDIITVKPGGRIPLDGIIIEGRSELDTSALTGESMPREVVVGDEALSGCINEGGMLRIRVTKPLEESTVSRILALVEGSAENKSKNENFITKFARFYTPIVVISALLLASLPPIFIGISDGGIWREWIMRAMTFLVISCPCALVISVPLSYFSGIGAASKKGILIKGSNYLDALSKCDTIVFDKTGTLTCGGLSVTDIIPNGGISGERLMSLAAGAEKYSTHPIAKSLLRHCNDKNIAPEDSFSDVSELSGFGVKAYLNEKLLLVGNERLMQANDIEYKSSDRGISVFIALDGEYIGSISLSDKPKENASSAIERLRASGIKNTVMLSGDREGEARRVANSLSLDSYRAELLPEDKVSALEEIISSSHGLCAYVGDGINDAPVLARADIGIAMGALGSDAAIETADIVLMNDNLEKISDALILSKRTRHIVIQNIVFALTVKGLALILGAFGLMGLGAAVFADVGVAVIAILNSMRNLK